MGSDVACHAAALAGAGGLLLKHVEDWKKWKVVVLRVEHTNNNENWRLISPDVSRCISEIVKNPIDFLIFLSSTNALCMKMQAFLIKNEPFWSSRGRHDSFGGLPGIVFWASRPGAAYRCNDMQRLTSGQSNIAILQGKQTKIMDATTCNDLRP